LGEILGAVVLADGLLELVFFGWILLAMQRVQNPPKATCD